MMWRLIDPRAPDVRRGARRQLRRLHRADLPHVRTSLVGRGAGGSTAGHAVIVVSDHGFHSFRRCVNLNTWLVQERVHGRSRAASGGTKTPRRPLRHGAVLGERGLGRTRAYSMGLGQIYFNLRGRESKGIVRAGADYTALQDEIVTSLPRTDPETGEGRRGGLPSRRSLYGGTTSSSPDLSRLQPRLPRRMADHPRGDAGRT